MVSIEERKFPTLLFISITLIIWNWLLKSSMVDLLSLLFLGYGIAFIISYLLLYLKIKISLHTGAIGGLIGFLIYFSYHYQINLTIFLAFFCVLCGLIASARLRLKAHTPTEVLVGFVIGLGTQLLAYLLYII
jgi:membrane-associated phospholipid phosphatase